MPATGETAAPYTTVVYLDVCPPARMPRDPIACRMLRPEQSTRWEEVARFGGVVVERRWVFTGREGWLWEDRGRLA
jgi:hypothetical protein